MIKANELRIGNMLSHPQHEGAVISINAKKPEETIIYIRGDYMTSNGDESLFNGILLTEEWLLKFGFNIENDCWEFIHDDETGFVMLAIDKDSMRLTTNDGYHTIGIRLTHVHQLQNLYFALTGNELTIKESVK